MTSASEDELLDALNWTEDSYTLKEFVTEFPLPQVVKVVRGHDGGTDSTTIGYGEVLTIHGVRETRVLSAEDGNSNAISIGFDFPFEFQILPQTKDCPLSSCAVADFPSFYRVVKYVEVIQADYGTVDDVGEILEILDISKPNKPDKMKVEVRHLDSNEKSTLTTTCCGKFKPLLDWKRYKAPQLRTHQFGFPIRVRLIDTDVEKDTDYQRLIFESPDINILNEVTDVIVISTTVSSDPVLKFCLEIPTDVEIKVAVAEGFSNGAKHYTNIVTSLNERFDVTKFMSDHQPAPLKRRDIVKQYDYDAIEEYIVDISEPDEVEPEIDVPPLPPRTPQSVRKTQSFDIPPTPPPKEPRRKISAPGAETTELVKSRPAVAPRPRSVSQREGVAVEWIASGNNNFHALSTSVHQSTNEKPCIQSPPEVKFKPPINIPTPPPNAPQSTNDLSKPPLKIPRNIPISSTTVPQTTSNHPNDQLQAELNKALIKKRSPKVPVSPRRPPVQDKSKHPQVDNGNDISKESNMSDKEKKIQTAAEVPPGGKDDTPVTQTAINHSTLPISQLKPVLPARFKPSKHSQVNNTNGWTTETEEKESLQFTNIHSPAKVPGETDATTTKQATEHAASVTFQTDENAQRPPRVTSPKLPPRNWQSKREGSATKFQDEIIYKTPRASGQAEIESQQMVKDEKTGTYVPRLPPKSPGRNRKVFSESNYVHVHPVLPPGNEPRHPPVSRTFSNTSSSRNNPIDRFQRPGTVPKGYKIGGNQPYTEQGQDSENLYEMPYDPPIMPVAPQMNTRSFQSPNDDNPYILASKVPLDLSGLSIIEVSDILRNLNMGQYAEKFENEMIDGDLLKELKESDLESFKMESIHRTKLLRFIKGWRPRLTAKEQHIT